MNKYTWATPLYWWLDNTRGWKQNMWLWKS